MLYITDTRRYLWRNFTAGIARGLEGAVGFTILGAIVAAVRQSAHAGKTCR